MEISFNSKILLYKVTTHFLKNYFRTCSTLALKLIWNYSKEYFLPIIILPSFVVGKKILL